jgi:hypothetical protein
VSAREFRFGVGLLYLILWDEMCGEVMGGIAGKGFGLEVAWLSRWHL